MNLHINAYKAYAIDPFYLSIYRLFYCVVILLFLGLPAYTWISSMPNYLYDPPALSIANLFDGFPGKAWMLALTVFNLLTFMCMFLGIKARWTSLLFSISTIIGHSFWYSFGKIDHMILWYLAPAFLGFAGWGNYFNLSGKKIAVRERDNALLIFLFALTIAFSMFTSGVQKLEGGWLNWRGEGVRYHLIRNFLIIDRTKFLAPYFLDFRPHLVWKLMDYSALFLEVGFLFSIVRLKYFRAFLVMAVFFHVAVLLMFNIAFYANLIAYSLFINWSSLFPKWKASILETDVNGSAALKRFSIVLALGFTSYWLFLLFFKPASFFLPGLIESCSTAMAVADPFQSSLSLMFLSALVLTLFLLLRSMFNASRNGIRMHQV